MSTSPLNFPDPRAQTGFDSGDAFNLVVDVQGDQTVRPLRPHLRELALAEREKLARLREQMAEEPRSEGPADQPEPGTSSP